MRYKFFSSVISEPIYPERITLKVFYAFVFLSEFPEFSSIADLQFYELAFQYKYIKIKDLLSLNQYFSDSFFHIYIDSFSPVSGGFLLIEKNLFFLINLAP